MKTKLLMNILIALLVVATFFLENAFACETVRSTGIGLRGSFWSLSDNTSHVTVRNNDVSSSVHVGGAGAYLYIFSRMNENMFIEFSVGAVGKVKEESVSYFESDVDVSAVTPILIGLRYDLLPPRTQSSLQPYLSLGGGPYWFTHVEVEDRLIEEEVTVSTKLKRGGYLGGGINFLLSNWCAINFDMKYHFINFDVNHVQSGFEYGFGINFMWGRYKL